MATTEHYLICNDYSGCWVTSCLSHWFISVVNSGICMVMDGRERRLTSQGPASTILVRWRQVTLLRLCGFLEVTLERVGRQPTMWRTHLWIFWMGVITCLWIRISLLLKVLRGVAEITICSVRECVSLKCRVCFRYFDCFGCLGVWFDLILSVLWVIADATTGQSPPYIVYAEPPNAVAAEGEALATWQFCLPWERCRESAFCTVCMALVEECETKARDSLLVLLIVSIVDGLCRI